MATKLELLNAIAAKVGGSAPASNEKAAWQNIQDAKLSIIGIQKSISGSTNETELQVIQDLVFQQGGTGTAETVLDNLNEWAGILGVPDAPSGDWDYEGELTAGIFDAGEGEFYYGLAVGSTVFEDFGSIDNAPIQVPDRATTTLIIFPTDANGDIGLGVVNDELNPTANEIEINGTVYTIKENGVVTMETSPFVDGVTYSIKLR